MALPKSLAALDGNYFHLLFSHSLLLHKQILTCLPIRHLSNPAARWYAGLLYVA